MNLIIYISVIILTLLLVYLIYYVDYRLIRWYYSSIKKAIGDRKYESRSIQKNYCFWTLRLLALEIIIFYNILLFVLIMVHHFHLNYRLMIITLFSFIPGLIILQLYEWFTKLCRLGSKFKIGAVIVNVSQIALGLFALFLLSIFALDIISFSLTVNSTYISRMYIDISTQAAISDKVINFFVNHQLLVCSTLLGSTVAFASIAANAYSGPNEEEVEIANGSKRKLKREIRNNEHKRSTHYTITNISASIAASSFTLFLTIMILTFLHNPYIFGKDMFGDTYEAIESFVKSSVLIIAGTTIVMSCIIVYQCTITKLLMNMNKNSIVILSVVSLIEVIAYVISLYIMLLLCNNVFSWKITELSVIILSFIGIVSVSVPTIILIANGKTDESFDTIATYCSASVGWGAIALKLMFFILIVGSMLAYLALIIFMLILFVFVALVIWYIF